MKILMISNMYPSKKFPGYGAFIKNFEESLIQHNINVEKIVLTKTNNKFFKIIKYFLHYIKIIFKCLNKNYDLIYVNYVSHNALPVLIARKFKKFKIYCNLHGSDLITEKKSQEKFKKYTKKILEISERIVVPSKYFKEITKQTYDLNEEIISIYPSGGINTNKFYTICKENIANLKLKYGINDKAKIIGYVGRIEPNKGWNIFLESIKILKAEDLIPQKSVIVVGNGSEINKFNDFIKKNELEEYIIYLDLLPQEKLVEIYNSIDIFSFPTFKESLGLVGVEAMYCNCVIVGSDIGALREYIEDSKNGYKFTPGDFHEQAEIFKMLLNMKDDKFNRLKKKAKEVAELYRSDIIENKIKDIFI